MHPNQEAVLKYVTQHGPVRWKQVYEGTGITSGLANAALRELAKRFSVMRNDDGAWYVPTKRVPVNDRIFLSPKPCPHNHQPQMRYKSNHRCVECLRLRNKLEAVGLKTIDTKIKELMERAPKEYTFTDLLFALGSHYSKDTLRRAVTRCVRAGILYRTGRNMVAHEPAKPKPPAAPKQRGRPRKEVVPIVRARPVLPRIDTSLGPWAGLAR